MRHLLQLHVVAVLVALACIAAPQAAQQQSISVLGKSVVVWRPDNGGKQPVIVFSHGFHGCATQSRFLMEAFASAGYYVFAPNHADATCAGGGSRWSGRPDLPFQKPEQWDQSTYRERADDIRRIIEALSKDERFRNRADWSRLALAGHSLGGYTVLGLAGAWPGWKLPGVKAVLALSPYSQPFALQHTLGGVSAPLMYQGGTRDLGITPTLHKSQGSYDQSPAPKYYVEFDMAGHFAWTDVSRTAHDGIVAYSLAFMNHYLNGLPADPLLMRGAPGVASFRYQSELGSTLGSAR